MIMRSIVTRLILWIAEMLDRNLITVPDLDPYEDVSGHPRKRRALAMGVSGDDVDHG
jgi:hypothetical protein